WRLSAPKGTTPCPETVMKAENLCLGGQLFVVCITKSAAFPGNAAYCRTNWRLSIIPQFSD
ncbi:MAG: hypothetical protein OSB82_21590, partial [Alphaproteobacteria bacterium]|nr:hypothetical protein [Alphaproteobacteria bacterium]